ADCSGEQGTETVSRRLDQRDSLNRKVANAIRDFALITPQFHAPWLSAKPLGESDIRFNPFRKHR
ncbi:MAG TPA: hypothetical protein VIE65_06025, partial [Methylobacter sp.]